MSAPPSPAAELKELMLRKPRLTLAVAESLTCGRLQAAIGAVSGASDFFLGGMTAYALAEKVRHLGVDRAHARRVDAVSQRVAVEMARGAAELFGSDLAASTTGYAEPHAAAGVKVPLAWWAICHRRRGGRTVVISGLVTVPGAKRVAVQEEVAAEVVRQLVAYLRELRAGRRAVSLVASRG
jgi:nicotinamide-nucleotide amidase